ncbi:MAG: ABC transporter substrate-binding protein [Candidatus Tectomicrobia bacterium]|uniref:ABC transporter substrate-binding protein n=1 Tax=Tectimicrobiota bacterium TaxID=2528274 RepID=A0A932MPX8_UNCTE|nr:ABC transporter substrate-binding protein [Candidatus Tectomicrobia bacterium]
MRRIFFSIAVCAVLVSALGAPPRAGAAKKGGTLRIAMEGNIPHMDGTVVLGLPIKFYREISGSSLVMVNEKYEIVGDLAHKWEFSDEGRVITFHLRPGAKFHDGTPLDAEAVKWNFDLINGRLETDWMKEEKKKNPKFKFNSSYNLYLYQVKKVEVVDKHTVRLHQQDLGKGMTLPALAGYFTRITFVSPTAYNRDYDKFKRLPVYSGPFKITEYKHNQLVVMERFKDYYIKDRPHLDRIEIYYMPDANQRLNALRAGQIDMIFSVPLSLVATLEKTPGVKLHTGRTATTMGIPINNQRGPFKDVRVRKALGCHGIDRALIVRTALRGLSEPWASFSGPGARDAIDLTAECRFDPAKVKSLLAEAGYGPQKPFKFQMPIINSDPTYAEIAQIMKTTYGQMGIQMDIQVLDRATWVNLFVLRRVADMTIQDTLPTFDFNSASHTFYSKTFLDYYMMKDPKVDAMVEEWRSTIDPKKQIEISHRLQRYIVDQGYYPSVAGSPFIQATRDYVKDFAFRNKIIFTLRDTWLDK